MEISIVVPIYNEVENIPLLYNQLRTATPKRTHEFLFVDDGSTDGSDEALRQIAQRDNHVKVVRFRRNFGQTAAMQAGLDLAAGKVIVTLDGDLQNDPADIEAMLQEIDQGFDLVHGWRKERHDAWWSRKLPSKIANWLISRSTGFPIHDLGCTLKAMRREIADEIELYGEMHRFIPILAHRRGAKCKEMVVGHHPRRFGQTKYGISRTMRVVLDLITVKFLLCWLDSPMKLFGRMGIWCVLAGGLSGTATIGMKVFGDVDMTGNPLLLLTVFCWLTSIQLGSLGLLGEVITRLYYTRHGRRPYVIGQTINLQSWAEKQRAA